jgi:peptidoglycan/LPS O-acetylase OafA/YrhL
MPKIQELSTGRNNNFDIIRFILASLVIFSHSSVITYGKNDILSTITGNKISFGALSVACFFIISGFLVTKSYERYNNIRKYLKARFYRIYPGLITVVLFSTFIIGPIVTIYPIKSYFTNFGTYKYVMYKMIPLTGHQTLPGVFVNNPENAVNGSLWSIAPEIWCYIGIAILGVLKILRFRHVILIIWILLIIFSNIINYIDIKNFYFLKYYIYKMSRLIVFFLSGTLLYKYSDIIELNNKNIILSFLGLIFLFLTGLIDIAIGTSIAYLLIYLSFNKRLKFYNFAKYGDFSYGIYIYGFLMQQFFTYYILKYNLHYNYIINFIIPYIAILFLAYLSWNIVEKRFLKLSKTK